MRINEVIHLKLCLLMLSSFIATEFKGFYIRNQNFYQGSPPYSYKGRMRSIIQIPSAELQGLPSPSIPTLEESLVP